LVVFDPVSSYLGHTDSHKNAEIRAVLAPLSDLAARHRVAVVAVTHLRKSDGPAVYRALGSVGFVAAARAAWSVSKDKDNPRRRLFLPVKNNLAGDVQGLAFTIEPAGSDGSPVVAWEREPVCLSADDALAGDRGGGGDGHDAADFLREVLAGGEQPATVVLKQARANGFSDKVTRKAIKGMGGKIRRVGFGVGGTWFWSLPGTIDGPDSSIDGIDARPEQGESMPSMGNQWGDDRGDISANRSAADPVEPSPVVIPPDWTPKRWMHELRRKAGACEEHQPDIAAHYRTDADAIEAELGRAG
jgi:hypothetical protein